MPALSVLILSKPLPEVRAAEPIVLPPSLKVIVPVAELGATVAVSVIACPDPAVPEEDASVTVVACSCAPPTRICTTLEVDEASVESPAYEAVMLCVPAESDDIVKLAAPLARVAEAREVEPSIKLTVPDGVGPLAAETVTLKVSDCPALICVAEADSEVVVAEAAVAAGCTTNKSAE